MAEFCSATNCTSRKSKEVELKFHRFPKDLTLNRLWLNAMRRVNYTPSSAAVICENHFTTEDYVVNVHGNRVLKKGAIPSVFHLPSHLKKELKNRIVSKRHIKTISPTEQAAKNRDELPMYIENKEIPELMDLASILNMPESSASEDEDTESSTSMEVSSASEDEDPESSTSMEEPGELSMSVERTRREPRRRRSFWQVSENKTVIEHEKLKNYFLDKFRSLELEIFRQVSNLMLEQFRSNSNLAIFQAKTTLDICTLREEINKLRNNC